MLGGLPHGAKDCGVVKHKNARIRHEELETRDAFTHKFAHFFKLCGAEVGDDAVEGVVGHGLVMRLPHPGIKSLAECLSFILDSEIDEGGGAAKGCGNRARLEVVRAGGAAERHVEVSVHVDATRDDEKSRGINDFAGVLDGELRGYRGNFVTVDTNVRGERVGRRDDRAIADDGVKAQGRASHSGLIYLEMSNKIA